MAHGLPVLFIFCLLPPLQMLQEHCSFLGISGVTEKELLGMNMRTGETDVRLALCGCSCGHSRAAAVRLDAKDDFSQEFRVERIIPG